jgi:hypothetical protein
MMVAPRHIIASQDAGTSQLPKLQPITRLAKTVTSMSRNIVISTADQVENICSIAHKNSM